MYVIFLPCKLRPLTAMVAPGKGWVMTSEEMDVAGAAASPYVALVQTRTRTFLLSGDTAQGQGSC